MPDDDDDALWSFAVEIYARSGVKTACLRLQDEHGFDVDLLLAALWLAARGGRLDAATIAALRTLVAPMRDWIARARELRRRATRHADDDASWRAVADASAAAELAGERAELSMLYGRLCRHPLTAETPHDAAWASLRAYAEILGVSDADEALAILVAALDEGAP